MRRFFFNLIVLPAALIAAAYVVLFQDLRDSGFHASGFLAELYGASNPSTAGQSNPDQSGSEIVAPLPNLVNTRMLAEEIIVLWSTLMKEHDIEGGALAIVRPQGQIVSFEIGQPANIPMHLGTLSVPITGLCMGQVLAENDLPWSTTLGDISAQLAARDIVLANWSLDIPLSDLATHQNTQIEEIARAERGVRPTPTAPQHLDITRRALAETAPGEAIPRAFINLTHYAILGTVIEALTGEDYDTACQRLIMGPAQVTGASTDAFSSYAGWIMSAVDAARLTHHWFADRRPWIANPLAFPSREMRGRPRFATGYYIDGSAHRSLTTRQTTWCPRGLNGPNSGAQLLHDGRGFAVVAIWQGCHSGRAQSNFENAIVNLLR